ncbi:MAG: hypothetical protein Q9190_005044, partial [Brigantiaea leucoxantha]
MRHIANLPTTVDALLRVFNPLFYSSLRLASYHPHNLLTRPLPNRHAHYTPFSRYAAGAQSSAPQTHGPPRDEAIRAPEIHIVSPTTGSLLPPTTLRSVLHELDRSKNFVIQVGDTVHPSAANIPPPEPGASIDTRPRIPVCKIVDKVEYRQAEKERQKSKKDAGTARTKQVEVNWGIDGHDLEIRLRRMEEFLNKGKRVEVVFGKKRK